MNLCFGLFGVWKSEFKSPLNLFRQWYMKSHTVPLEAWWANWDTLRSLWKWERMWENVKCVYNGYIKFSSDLIGQVVVWWYFLRKVSLTAASNVSICLRQLACTSWKKMNSWKQYACCIPVMDKLVGVTCIVGNSFWLNTRVIYEQAGEHAFSTTFQFKSPRKWSLP